MIVYNYTHDCTHLQLNMQKQSMVRYACTLLSLMVTSEKRERACMCCFSEIIMVKVLSENERERYTSGICDENNIGSV